ncbi:MAG: sugar ABC transporter substrate-binding protein [Limnochordales bacterium]
MLQTSWRNRMAVLVLVVLALAALAVPAAAQLPSRIVIGWAPPDITGVFKTATDFFELAAQDARRHGINVEIITRSPTSHTAFADQVAILEDFIQRRVDVIAVSPIEVEVIRPALRMANEAGIPVIVVNLLEPIEGVEVASYIGFDNAVAAAVTAYSLLDYFGGPGVLGDGPQVDVPVETYLDLEWWENLYAGLSDADRAAIRARGAIIEGVAGGFFSTARLNGFHSVIDQYPGIEIVGVLPADWNREKGIRAAEDFLSANPPGTLDFIWAASNEMGLGAMLAVEAAGRQDEVKIFTNDVTPESVARIREGRLMAETWHGFPEWGWFGTKFAVRLALGLDVPQFFDIRPRTVHAGNAHLFYPEPALEPIDWEAIKQEAMAGR